MHNLTDYLQKEITMATDQQYFDVVYRALREFPKLNIERLQNRPVIVSSSYKRGFLDEPRIQMLIKVDYEEKYISIFWHAIDLNSFISIPNVFRFINWLHSRIVIGKTIIGKDTLLLGWNFAYKGLELDTVYNITKDYLIYFFSMWNVLEDHFSIINFPMIAEYDSEEKWDDVFGDFLSINNRSFCEVTDNDFISSIFRKSETESIFTEKSVNWDKTSDSHILTREAAVKYITKLRVSTRNEIIATSEYGNLVSSEGLRKFVDSEFFAFLLLALGDSAVYVNFEQGKVIQRTTYAWHNISSEDKETTLNWIINFQMGHGPHYLKYLGSFEENKSKEIITEQILTKLKSEQNTLKTFRDV